MYSYLVSTTQYRRSTGIEDYRVTASANNVLHFFAARLQSQSIRFCASCKQRRLVFVACHLADKDLSHKANNSAVKDPFLSLTKRCAMF